VQRYVEAVILALPRSPPLELQSQCHNPDGRLVSLLELKHYGAPLRFCTPRQSSMLIHLLCGQMSEPIHLVSSTGHAIQTGARTRCLTHTDLARMYQLTARQVRSELERARRAVGQALAENWERPARRSEGICCG